jgi:LytS/YehU family sensor histidine kinase
VPPMMLQTLVENAIKHGISKQVHGGVVRIISDIETATTVLRVQNTGTSKAADQQRRLWPFQYAGPAEPAVWRPGPF